LDPGKASGLAIYSIYGTVVDMRQSNNGVEGFVRDFKDMLGYYDPDHIVCESFNLRSSNKFLADLSSPESIGWLKGEGYKVHFVTPSQHKTLVKDSVLTPMMKSGGFPVGAGHTRDALRTAVWYSARVLNHRPTLELLKPKEEK
jgi:hypothetical protein